MAESQLTSRRPYLLRAMHEWITDNGQTPHIVVDATLEGVDVPRQYIQSGKIVLNASHSATQGLVLGNDVVRFRARFGTVPFDISIPIGAVLGVYARETGQGMIFSENEEPSPPAAPQPPAPTKPTGSEPSKRPVLKVVK